MNKKMSAEITAKDTPMIYIGDILTITSGKRKWWQYILFWTYPQKYKVIKINGDTDTITVNCEIKGIDARSQIKIK